MATTSSSSPPSSNKDEAQAPYTAAFARLGRHVWFSLESAHRADPSRAQGLEKRLAAVGAQMKQVADMGVPWMAVGDWSARRTWSDEQWRAFLRTWKKYAAEVFGGDTITPPDELKLMELFSMYWNFYACLPDRPEEAPPADTKGFETIQAVEKRVDETLGLFAARLGDPTEPCRACGKCAVGHKLKRCGRCKLVWYCSQECQKQDWGKGRHKRSCVSILKQDPKHVDRLVQKRYKELRRQGKSAKEAMQKARAEYDQDKRDGASGDVGQQVASMFGLSA